ncbi:GNAT family N-acetyltransferase [Brevibacillus invocatus]|uniref:GNAT family N-acetyltransferase n=1 Tax=Brevibacillus invocatus TaxID=173959 RepID=A0A3M8CHK0_9BACL|nr:GNAT family N-acetyltransferase [Brevibacillus invocatus]
MSFFIRQIQLPKDYPALARLKNQLQPGATSAEELEQEDRQIPARSRLFKDETGALAGFGRERYVAECARTREIIGYAAVWRAPWTPPGALSSEFYVDAEHRQKGIGAGLLTRVIDWATEHQADLLMAEIKDWITESLPFASKRGFQVDAHVYELRLNLEVAIHADSNDFLSSLCDRGFSFFTLAEASLSQEEALKKLYELYLETLRDNPGHVGGLPDFSEWQQEAYPDDRTSPELVFIAADGDHFVGVTTLFLTDEPGVLYTDYTGVLQGYRGIGIARVLKLLSFREAKKRGAHTMATETEAKNGPMQAVNQRLGYLPGKGHYRIIKKLQRESAERHH